MQRILTRTILTALALGLALGAPVPAAAAAGHDGNWSVLIITEKGDCDRAYRYGVNVADGHVHYRGEASVNMSGTVAPSGAVKVSIRLGDKGASGTGRLYASGGSGTWHGVGSGKSCAGRWEAERR